MGIRQSARRILSRLTASKSAGAQSPAVPADDLLVAGLRAGDPEAVESLLARYEARIYRLALGITRNSADAEEVCQDVFLNVFRNIEGFEGKSSLGTWIYRIATNAALMKVRGKSRSLEVPWDEVLPRFSQEGSHLTPVPDWSKDPEAALLQTELRTVLGQALEDLPGEYRAVVLLRDVEGLPTDEAANALGLTVPALKARLHRGRLFLRGRLGEYAETHGRPTPKGTAE
ncbi:MAG: sigma-70 family RNA polymerase sigma factor [candidate division NC10 bacterium]|nr:sigma-70 family RNA polymerase sigma factor [candidate division NC10 bacterium]MBI3085154.1 sigma-70 family RNA polymerase sigma factor [candidate division NC10 bacterium]